MDDMRRRPHQGWIEVITGSMFSGKSEELIRRLRRAQIAKQRVQVFKPLIDNRYSADHVTSHSEMRMPSTAVASAAALLDSVGSDTEVVGIDEAQFFDAQLPRVCGALADRGLRVIVAGLDKDYLGRPFEPMPVLMAVAEYVTKTHAICVVCGAPANHTQRLVVSGARVLVGAQGTYEARCRACFDPSLAGEPDMVASPTASSAAALATPSATPLAATVTGGTSSAAASSTPAATSASPAPVASEPAASAAPTPSASSSSSTA